MRVPLPLPHCLCAVAVGLLCSVALALTLTRLGRARASAVGLAPGLAAVVATWQGYAKGKTRKYIRSTDALTTADNKKADYTRFKIRF